LFCVLCAWQILSQGSDPKALQPFYEKLFDSVDRVTHDRKQPNAITHLRKITGKDYEEVPLLQSVLAGSGPVHRSGAGALCFRAALRARARGYVCALRMLEGNFLM
jgi:hypothetical protein